jgi:membrane protease YdiL (CAAX protease family)
MPVLPVIRALFVFSIVFISAILFGALLAYPVYEIFSEFTEIPFRKIISRTTQLSGLLFSLLYFSCGNGLSLRQLGIRFCDAHTRLFQGLAAGLVIIAIIESSLLFLGIHNLDNERFFSFHALSMLLFKGLVTGLVVGVVEEIMFRGALLGGLNRRTNRVIALVTVSLVYAAVHYLKFRDLPVGAAIHWSTGLTMLPAALFQFADPARYDAMLTLFFLGLLLGFVRLLTGNLILCIGIHAGLITGEKLIHNIAHFMPYSPHAHLVNRYDPFLGELASAWLLVFCVSFYFYNQRKPHA